jgi:hypothetical protein
MFNKTTSENRPTQHAVLTADSYLAIAGILAGFGITAWTVRVEREITFHDKGEQNWIPWSEYLVISAILIALLLVVLPLVISKNPIRWPVARGGCAAASMLLAMYPLAIISHYEFFDWRAWTTGERILVSGAVMVAAATFLIILVRKR